MWPKDKTEKKMKLIPYRFIPKYRPRYRPVYRPTSSPFHHSRWDALIDMRRQQRHAYTPEEWEKVRPELIKRWQERHEKYLQESKEYAERMKAMEEKKLVHYKFLPKYKPRYRPVYHTTQRLARKAKYRCPICKAGFLWMNDFLNHIKKEHPGSQVRRVPSVTPTK